MLGRIFFGLITLVPAAAGAQPDGVTFDEALSLGERSPAVEARRRELGAREAGDRGIGGTATAPSLNVMPGAVLAPDQERGFDVQVSFTQGWNLGDLGGARRGAARREREALDAEVRAQALRARIEAARRWIELATLQRLEVVLGEQRAVAGRRVERARRALELGAGGASDLASAEAMDAQVDRRAAELEGERFDAASRLALAMGRAGAERLSARGPWPAPALPDLREARRLAEDLDELPEVAVRRLMASAARAREEEARARYAPVLSAGAQLERSSTDAWVLYGIAGLTFNAFGQERRAGSLAHAEAERLDAELDTARLRAQAEIERALHEVEHARRLARALDESLVPALDTLVERRERALAAGEETLFALLDARRDRLLAREAQARARGARTWAAVKLWLLLAELAR